MFSPCNATPIGEIARSLDEPLHRAECANLLRNNEPTSIAGDPRSFGETPVEAQPAAAATPEGIVSLADALAKLTSLLPDLADALDRQSKSHPPVARMTLRLDEVADALGVSRRVLERERAAGRMPKPDRRIGKMPLWRVETIHAWINSGGKGVA